MDNLLAIRARHTRVISVDDSTRQSGTALLRQFIANAVQRQVRVALVQMVQGGDMAARLWPRGLPRDQSTTGCCCVVDGHLLNTQWAAQVHQQATSGGPVGLCIVDHVNCLLLDHTPELVAAELARLVEKFIAGPLPTLLIFCVHRDLAVDREALVRLQQYLHRLCHTGVLSVHNAARYRASKSKFAVSAEDEELIALGDNDPSRGVVELRLRRRNGKSHHEAVLYETNSTTGAITAWSPAVGEQTAQPSNDPPSADDVPFNLSLTDEQRAARASVQLPYMKAQQQPAVTTQPQKGGPAIFYQPDAADDFDDEDPDDDLDI